VNLDPAPGTVAAVFVALAEPSRRQVIGVLAARGVATATSIAEDLAITRQAVTKHLSRCGWPPAGSTPPPARGTADWPPSRTRSNANPAAEEAH